MANLSSSSFLTPRTRFTLWIAAVLALLIGQTAALLADQFHAVAIGVFELPIALLAALLLTTPPTAIRLKPNASRLAITAGTLLLYASATLRHGRPEVATVLVLISVVAVFILQRNRVSPWWTVLLAWNPLLLAMLIAR